MNLLATFACMMAFLVGGFWVFSMLHQFLMGKCKRYRRWFEVIVMNDPTLEEQEGWWIDR